MKNLPLLAGSAIVVVVVSAFLFISWSNYEHVEYTTAKKILHSADTEEFAIELSSGEVLAFQMLEDYHERFPGYIDKYRGLIEGATVGIEKTESIYLGGQRSARESARLDITFDIPNRMSEFDLSSDIHYSHGGEFQFGETLDLSTHSRSTDSLGSFDSVIETPIKVRIVCKRYFGFGSQGPPGP